MFRGIVLCIMQEVLALCKNFSYGSALLQIFNPAGSQTSVLILQRKLQLLNPNNIADCSFCFCLSGS